MPHKDRLANASTRQEMIENLRELVKAIDKRARHLDQDGETEIARDAAALRQKAIERIAELEAGGN
jgi:hypothetical protein